MSRTTVSFEGNVVADPEELAGGKLLSYRVAVNRGVKKEDGTWEDKAVFYRVRDRNVERAKKFVKGTRLWVTGELEIDERPADKGGGFYPPSVFAWNVEVLKWANAPGDKTGGGAGNARAVKQKKANEDLPF